VVTASLSRKSFVRLALSALAVGAAVTACQSATPVDPTPQAKAAPNAAKLIIMSDLVQGSKNVPTDQQANACVLSSRFPRNAEMVWRARVYDPRTGDLMTKAELSKVQVLLANGKSVDMAFGPHPKNPPNEAYWTGSWLIPKDNPTGTLNYSIVAASTDGRTGEFKPFSVAASLPTITEQVLADVAAPTPAPAKS